MDGDRIDISSLSDEDLAKLLREHGVDVGPILDTTRRVYQRKLLALLNDGRLPTSVPAPEYDEYDEYEEEEEEEEEDPEIIIPRKEIKPKTRVEARQRVLSEQPQPTAWSSGEDYTDRLMSATSSSHADSQQLVSEPETPRPQTQKKAGGLSIWLQLGIFVVVALLIFLVIQNMEPAREDPLKQLEEV